MTNTKIDEPTAEHKRASISLVNRQVLWARAAGRCQYTNCNRTLIGDLISGNEDKHFGFIAHIVADAPNGPRGDLKRSRELANDLSNLMLLCDTHHKLIDVGDVAGHPEERLKRMKEEHERHVEFVAQLTPDRKSHMLRYAAKIGAHESPINPQAIRTAILPARYPAQWQPIDIELLGSADEDWEPDYWVSQRKNLQRQFEKKVRERIQTREIHHLSVFALAPQPLLMELGRLLGDILPADVHQLKREPAEWGWLEGGPALDYRIERPTSYDGAVALVLAVSATVTNARVTPVLGDGASIWRITVDEPGNDVMRHACDLVAFRTKLRGVFDEIKGVHGNKAPIHVFPALPLSAAVEVGRVWMPKADLPLVVYDQNRSTGGFTWAFNIDGEG